MDYFTKQLIYNKDKSDIFDDKVCQLKNIYYVGIDFDIHDFLNF